MYTIVGLGNPGDTYAHTRHNVGWTMLMDVIEKRGLPSLVKSGQFSGLLSEGILSGSEVGILLPTTYMNKSGSATRTYIRERGDPEKLIVVHDDVALPLGDVRISYDRGAGGHNGVKSVIDAMTHARFARVRIGIAPKNIFGMVKRPTGDKLSDFVLGEFKSGEQKQFPEIVEKVDRALELIVTQGIEQAMQKCNK
jgi:peptidyl-tRNA hydrolase, PTH1 family